MKIRCQQCGERLDATARFCGVCGTSIADANIGRVIGGRYTLKERLSEGSIGVIYAAEQVSLRRKLAIKLLPADALHDQTLIERFRREGEVLCMLRSPHTVTTYEFDRDPDGTPYIAMEPTSGITLAEAFRRDGAFEWPRVLRILAGLCDSLGEAHGLGVVHRNLKLENILIEPRAGNPDFVKVLDFGLAKLMPARIDLSPVGETVGAIEFMSPEQLMSKPMDGRSDLYALGVLGYLLVTGRHPFARARTYGDLVGAHIQIVPEPASSVRADLSPEVDMVFARCLEKDPDRRFPDAASLAALIGVMLAPMGFEAPPGDTLHTPIGDEDTALAPMPSKPPR
jgi:eukaryotic-like serine/threonine-protein kinase